MTCGATVVVARVHGRGCTPVRGTLGVLGVSHQGPAHVNVKTLYDGGTEVPRLLSGTRRRVTDEGVPTRVCYVLSLRL